MTLDELELPEGWYIPDAKKAVMAFIDALHRCKVMNDWRPIQDWIDDHSETAEDVMASVHNTESTEGL